MANFRHMASRFFNLLSYLIFVKLDIFFKTRKSYKESYITQVIQGENPSIDKIAALFLFYEPDGKISGSVTNAISSMQSLGINIILICNHQLSEAQETFFKKTCSHILLRSNQGFDFGGFKDAFAWFLKANKNTSRLIFANDSVFYVQLGLDEFFQNLSGDAYQPNTPNAIAAFENWGEGYHMQSFSLSVDDSIFKNLKFIDFWKKYIPVNNRVYAIEYGEKRLSDTILACASSTEVIFTQEKLYAALTAEQTATKVLHKLPHQWRSSPRLHESEDFSSSEIAFHTVSLINETSPIHSGAYFFAKYLKCPIFKKDLVFRSRFSFWEIDNLTQEFMNQAERREFSTILRKKGESSKLGTLDRAKFNVGVK